MPSSNGQMRAAIGQLSAHPATAGPQRGSEVPKVGCYPSGCREGVSRSVRSVAPVVGRKAPSARISQGIGQECYGFVDLSFGQARVCDGGSGIGVGWAFINRPDR